MDLKHIDWQTWCLIAVIAGAFVAIAIGYLINVRDDRQANADPLNHLHHPAAILRDWVQALFTSRSALGLGEATEGDADYTALRHAQGEARRGILGIGYGAAEHPPAPPPAAVGQPHTLTIEADNMRIAIDGDQVFPPPEPQH